MDLIELDRFYHDHHAAAAALWTAACGPDLAISPAFVAFNTRPTTGIAQAGRLALEAGRPIGFVLASAVVSDPTLTTGWIDAIAVAPEAQRQGVGSALLSWAEAWLRAQGCTRARLGGSLRPFAPGLPVPLAADFFLRRGYTITGAEWDVARDLADYPNDPAYATDAILRPTRPGEEPLLLEFLAREFPGRWHFECQEFLREGGRAADWLLLWPAGAERPVGFCQVTLEDSLRPIERFYPHRLPRPWGQFGPLGVAREARGQGYGAAVVDGAARYLRDLGVRGCVIDWTDLVAFYGKFGFQPYRQYQVLVKALV